MQNWLKKLALVSSNVEGINPILALNIKIQRKKFIWFNFNEVTLLKVNIRIVCVIYHYKCWVQSFLWEMVMHGMEFTQFNAKQKNGS